jgi:hypothetical protein
MVAVPSGYDGILYPLVRGHSQTGWGIDRNRNREQTLLPGNLRMMMISCRNTQQEELVGIADVSMEYRGF